MTIMIPALPELEFALVLPCHEQDPELFFAEHPSTIEQAKAVCGPCPLRAECLEGALRRNEPHGVWGGELLVNGEIVAQKRPRGRPRKHPVQTQPAAEQPGEERGTIAA